MAKGYPQCMFNYDPCDRACRVECPYRNYCVRNSHMENDMYYMAKYGLYAKTIKLPFSKIGNWTATKRWKERWKNR